MNKYIDKCGSCVYYNTYQGKGTCNKVSGKLSVFPSKPKCRKYIRDPVLNRPNPEITKKCSECEYSNEKGVCKFYTLYAYLRNQCKK